MSGARLTLKVLSVLLAAALLVLGVLVVVEVVLAALGQPAWLLPYSDVATTLRGQTWQSGLARAVGAALCVLGLLLLLASLRRGRPTALPLAPFSEGVDSAVSRRGLQTVLAGAARRTDGVRRAKASVGRRRVKVKTVSRLRDTSGLPQRVEAAVRAELEELALRRTLAVKVTTKRSS